MRVVHYQILQQIGLVTKQNKTEGKMKRKQAKKILLSYKLLKYILVGIAFLLLLVPISLTFYSKIPFFPFVFFLLFFVFIGHPVFIKLFYKKNIFCYSNNDRKSIKYIIVPDIIASLIIWLIYWKPCSKLASIMISNILRGN